MVPRRHSHAHCLGLRPLVIPFTLVGLLNLVACGASPDDPGQASSAATELVTSALTAPARPAARLIAPISGSLAGARRPELRWAGPPNALFEICAERTCRSPIATFEARGNGNHNVARPPLALPTGVVFWRVRAPAADRRAAFTPAWELFVPPGGHAPAATRGLRYDADADGFVDAAVRDQNENTPSDVLHVYRGGRGHRSSGLDPSTATVLTLDTTFFGGPVVSVGDINGDGFGDLAVADGRGVVIYGGSAAGVVSTPLSVIPRPEVAPLQFASPLVAAGDVDGDGYGDVFVGSTHLSLYRGSAGGLSATPAWTLDRGPGGGSAGVLACADLDGDGFGDLVVNEFRTAAGSGFRVFRGSAAGLEPPSGGTFVPRPELPFGTFGTAGDIDGDGISDLVLFDGFSPATLELFPGGATFPAAAAAEVVTLADRPGLLNIGDFDGDGHFDVAVLTSIVSAESFFFTDDRIDVFPGGASGFAPAPTVTILETNLLPDDHLNVGTGFSSGDFGRSGHEDLLVGAGSPFPTPFYDASSGALFVLPGSPAGLQSTPTLQLRGGPGFGQGATAGAPQEF